MVIIPGRFTWERAVCYSCSLNAQVDESVRAEELCRVKAVLIPS